MQCVPVLELDVLILNLTRAAPAARARQSGVPRAAATGGASKPHVPRGPLALAPSVDASTMDYVQGRHDAVGSQVQALHGLHLENSSSASSVFPAYNQGPLMFLSAPKHSALRNCQSPCGRSTSSLSAKERKVGKQKYGVTKSYPGVCTHTRTRTHRGTDKPTTPARWHHTGKYYDVLGHGLICTTHSAGQGRASQGERGDQPGERQVR